MVRTDSSAEIGAGHVMRSLALGEALREGGAQVDFACRDLPGAALDAIESRRGFRLHRLPAGAEGWQLDLERALAAVGRADWIVVDHYGLDARWEAAAGRSGARILVIDDLADRAHDCDVLVDQNFHRSPRARYASRVPERCRLMLGPRFALVRSEFRGAQAAERDGTLRRVWISYGRGDEDGETLKALEALRLAALPGVRADVLVGAANPHAAAIRRAAAEMQHVALHTSDRRMAELMAAADVAFGAGGVSMWERCALGLPSIVTAIAENQVAPSEAMGEAGLSVYLGRSAEVSAAEMSRALRRLAGTPAALKGLSQAVRALVDGAGARRVSAAMTEPAVVLREARAEDCDRVHAWRNHPSVREVSHDPAAIDLAMHRKWYAAALADASRLLMIIEQDRQAVGVLRYDIAGSVATVSIYLDPAQVGRGIGPAALRAGTQRLRRERPQVRRIRAELVSGNAQSAAAFVKAGYERRSERIFEETADVA